MVLGYHLIVTAYGFWLPNDPRGSWSDFVRAWELVRFGKPIKTDTYQSTAHDEHDWQLRLKAKKALQHAPVHFDGLQAIRIMEGIREVRDHWNLHIHACSIMPDHVHLVLGRTARNIRLVMNQMKGRASQRLAADGRHPFQDVPSKRERVSCWTRKGWHVFLSSSEDMRRAIAYVEQNPVKEGYKPQKWSMVEPYAGAR